MVIYVEAALTTGRAPGLSNVSLARDPSRGLLARECRAGDSLIDTESPQSLGRQRGIEVIGGMYTAL